MTGLGTPPASDLTRRVVGSVGVPTKAVGVPVPPVDVDPVDVPEPVDAPAGVPSTTVTGSETASVLPAESRAVIRNW